MPRRLAPRLLALLASPRVRGANARLLSAFVRGARRWSVRRFAFSELTIAAYTGKRRTISDDMDRLVEEFDRADALVLASPVYFYGFPAQAKAAIDRCQFLWNDPKWKTRPRRPAFFLSTCASSRRSEFDVIVREARAFLHTIGFEVQGELLLPGLDAANAPARLTQACARARGQGARFHRLLPGLPHD